MRGGGGGSGSGQGGGRKKPLPRPTHCRTPQHHWPHQKLKHILRQLTPSSYGSASVGDNRRSSVNCTIVSGYSRLQGLTTPFVVVAEVAGRQAASI